jgi:guanylate kinase
MSFILERVSRGKGEMKEIGAGLIIIISAPSGTGKTTLVKEVMDRLPGLQFSVSYTTRLPRPNEKEGEDYHFVSHFTFQKMVKNNDFLEWAEVLGNLYGTPRPDLNKLESGGTDLILDIDTQGTKKALKEINQPILVYLLPPSLKVLKERLINRGVDSIEMIKYRLLNARRDMQESHWYHYVIMNDKMEDAIEKLKAVIVAERCRKMKDLIIQENKKQWEENDG